MSLYLDQKYLLLLSNRLPLFKKKKDNTYNCRCVICGDSQKKSRKARGYFFVSKNSLMYKCFNCDVSMFFSKFLKKLDTTLHNEYLLESYKNNNTSSLKVTNHDFSPPKFKTKEENDFKNILTCLKDLDESNEAVQFCKSRKIPSTQFKKLFYVDNVKKLVKFNSDYQGRILTDEPRLVIPFYDNDKRLTGFACRGLRKEALRYLNIKIIKDTPLIFGLPYIDKNKDVYVLEGAIDSLFLPNSIAVAGLSFDKIETLGISKDKLVLVFDNEPRNFNVSKVYERAINDNYRIVIWPQRIKSKDVNDMVMEGKDIKKIVRENIYNKLEAKVKFVEWKRV